MRLLYWTGWVLLLWAWADFGLGLGLGIDIWKEVFGLVDPSIIHYSPVIVSCIGVVLIAVGR
ncbi:hypothetical protein [Aestuariivirga litoralis]|uniref:hypothetical protein n=1 Tax=Aestuariivirga litoralis TaxID=2650924 RepID=UPI0011B7D0AE|nr:hypothetical protein [Aestuariivirga litoralis]